MSVVERILRRDTAPARPTGDVRLSPMRRGDLRKGVLDIEAAAYPKPWSPQVFRTEIDQARTGTRHYLTARREGQIVGYAGLWFASGDAHVTNVAVAPDARRGGVASTLLLALADRAISRECDAWTLEVRVSSAGAQDLYRKFGFVPAGVRKKYYENTEDAIVMWCHDIRSPEYRARLDGIAAALDRVRS